jgi:hypothetical protein
MFARAEGNSFAAYATAKMFFANSLYTRVIILRAPATDK